MSNEEEKEVSEGEKEMRNEEGKEVSKGEGDVHKRPRPLPAYSLVPSGGREGE